MNKQAARAALLSLALVGFALACDKREPLASGLSASRHGANIFSASDDAAADDVCTVETLSGGYGFTRSGTTTAGPLAAVGLTTYDGAGNWVTTQSLSRNGAFTFDATSSGTYVVNADCTGKLFSGDQEIGRLSIVEGGKTVFHLDETAQNQVTGTQKRVPRQGCSNASLTGSYGFYRSGMTSGGPLAAAGLAQYNGAGGSSAVQTNIRNGVINPDVAVDPTPYEVSADCTGRLFFGGREIARFVVVDKGREVYQLSEAAGNTVTGVQRRVGKIQE
jgi:hypothetical protein